MIKLTYVNFINQLRVVISELLGILTQHPHMRQNKKRSFTSNLLQTLVIGGLVIVASTNPLFGVKLIGAFQKELKRKKWREFYQNLYYLKRRGFIEIEQNPDGSYSVQTTDSGKRQSEKYDLDNITIKAPKKWDRQWRMIIFDIPAEKQKSRLALLPKLKELGFIMLQKSVWAHPFECHNEVAVLARAFEIDQYVKYLTCSKVSAAAYLQSEFEKRNNILLD